MITVSALPKDPASVTPIEAADLLSQLAEAIAYHNERYHGQDAPEISDQDFDKLMAFNLALEEAFPHLVKIASAQVKRLGRAQMPPLAKSHMRCQCSHWQMPSMTKMSMILSSALSVSSTLMKQKRLS